MKNIKNTTRLRISIFRSNKFIQAAFIDDEKNVTIFSMSTKKIDSKAKPVEKATLLGKALAEIAKEKKISEIVYDRNGYRYHGQVKALADGLREGGLKF